MAWPPFQCRPSSPRPPPAAHLLRQGERHPRRGHRAAAPYCGRPCPLNSALSASRPTSTGATPTPTSRTSTPCWPPSPTILRCRGLARDVHHRVQLAPIIPTDGRRLRTRLDARLGRPSGRGRRRQHRLLRRRGPAAQPVLVHPPKRRRVPSFYDKRHLFTFAGEHDHFTAGDDRVELEFRGFRILLQVCYDLRFPVFVRNDRHAPYDLALYVANWPETRRRLGAPYCKHGPSKTNASSLASTVQEPTAMDTATPGTASSPISQEPCSPMPAAMANRPTSRPPSTGTT